MVLQLDKGDYPENSHVVFCPDKERYFEALRVWILSIQLHWERFVVPSTLIKHSGQSLKKKPIGLQQQTNIQVKKIIHK